MALRTTLADVKAICPNTSAPDDAIEACIRTANNVVDEVLSSDSNISAAMKTDIEKYLAAHFAHMGPDRIPVEAQIGDVKEVYGKAGLHLDATPYGQTAKQIDTTGKIGNLGKKNAIIAAITSFA